MTSPAPSRASAQGLRHILLDLLRVAVYNTGIAAFLSALNDYGFLINLTFSQCIGLSISLSMSLLCRLRGRDKPGAVDALGGIPIGFAMGFVLGAWLTGYSLENVMERHPQAVFMSAAAAVVFGVIATFYFYSQVRLQELQEEARQEKLKRLEQEALAATAELRLLQAQIEPHFLFNTLSVVVGLVDTRPASARNMLLNLVALLRGGMVNMRRESVTLETELALLRAYLGIMAERMGERLQWRIEADDKLLQEMLPPLLVQPLVENAIRHGLEPKEEGGHLTVRCRREGARLVIEVEDDGRGMSAHTGGTGVGLQNIRERLKNRYGPDASLALEPRHPGMLARLELPCAS